MISWSQVEVEFGNRWIYGQGGMGPPLLMYEIIVAVNEPFAFLPHRDTRLLAELGDFLHDELIDLYREITGKSKYDDNHTTLTLHKVTASFLFSTRAEAMRFKLAVPNGS